VAEHMFNNLPRWTINETSDILIDARYYLQFTGLSECDSDKYYYFLDLKPIDPILKEEVSNNDLDSILNKSQYNNINRPPLVKMFDNFKYETYNEISNILINDYEYIILDLIYSCSNQWYVECDLDFEITEYMSKLEKKKFNYE
jgi:hypothetical protein